MALSSPSHRFGQIIGDVLEEAMIQYLRPVADKYSLYLDHRHARPARRGQKEVRWVDINGNTHKLDIVMERKGNETILGEPCVFIEMAWRRYTKHSRNKAQEISGAIRPLIAKYRDFTPFFGAIVAGVFTQSSLNQMRSEGFEVVYIPIGIIEKAFGIVGINAHWEENTPDYVLQQKVDDYERLDSSGVEQIKTEILRLTSEQLSKFCHKLSNSLERKIDAIRIISIFGDEGTFSTIDEACNFIVTSNYRAVQPEFYRYEIYIRYSNGDKLEAQYTEISNAVAFLQSLGL